MGDCKKELETLLGQERLAGASLLVFANKRDLPGALPMSEIASALGLESIEGRHWSIAECSAVTGEGLEQGVKWIVQDISARIFSLE